MFQEAGSNPTWEVKNHELESTFVESIVIYISAAG